MIDYPNKLNIIFDKLDNFNIKPIIIGGYNRDFILNIASKDIDIELYGVSSLDKVEEILREFGSVNSVGKSFGVTKLLFEKLDLDFSLPRTDNKVDSGHTGFKITTDKNLDFKTATSRRDFTINAIGYDIKQKKILDPFNGVEDIKHKTLKAVDINKFDEDPLRVLRAIQFSARFNFTLDSQLLNKCKNMMQNNSLSELARERIFQEIKKLLLKSKSPSHGFLLLRKINGFNFFKEFLHLSHKDYDETLKTIDLFKSYNIESENTNIIIMLALLCYHFSLKDRETFLKRLTTQKDIIQNINLLLNNKESINLDKFTNYDIYTLATKLKIQTFIPFLKALNLGKKDTQLYSLEIKANLLNVYNEKMPAFLEGKDLLNLGLKPSKEFSIILENAYIAQMRGEFKTKEEAELYLKKKLLS